QPPVVRLPLLPEPSVRSRGRRLRAAAAARPTAGFTVPGGLGGGGLSPEGDEDPAGAGGAGGEGMRLCGPGANQGAARPRRGTRQRGDNGVGDPRLGARSASGSGGVGVAAADGPGGDGRGAAEGGGGLLRVPCGGGGVPQVPEDGGGHRVTATAEPRGPGAHDRVAERGGGAAGEPARGGAATGC